MDSEVKMMLNAILEEIGKVQEKTTERFDSIDGKLDSMQHEIIACKLERDSVSILFKKIDQLEQRIDELEKRIA